MSGWADFFKAALVETVVMALRLISVVTVRSQRLRPNTYSGSIPFPFRRVSARGNVSRVLAHEGCGMRRPRNKHRVIPSKVHARCRWLSALVERSPVFGGLVVGADRAWHHGRCLKSRVMVTPEDGEVHSRTSGFPPYAFARLPSSETHCGWRV